MDFERHFVVAPPDFCLGCLFVDAQHLVQVRRLEELLAPLEQTHRDTSLVQLLPAQVFTLKCLNERLQLNLMINNAEVKLILVIAVLFLRIYLARWPVMHFRTYNDVLT